MKHIFVDFEMHPIAKEFQNERKICPCEIIEFGAVMLDDDFIEISSFKEFVRPKYVKKIYKTIKSLTGITNEKIISAKSFNEVFSKFIEWCYSYNEQITVYAWSGSDLAQITREMQLKRTEITYKVRNILSNWVDFQKDYCKLVKVDKMISLENALNSVGKYFLGNKHDALCDARNTADLFNITRDKDEFNRLLKLMKDLTHHQEEKVTSYALGDLIDFSTLNLSFT